MATSVLRWLLLITIFSVLLDANQADLKITNNPAIPHVMMDLLFRVWAYMLVSDVDGSLLVGMIIQDQVCYPEG